MFYFIMFICAIFVVCDCFMVCTNIARRRRWQRYCQHMQRCAKLREQKKLNNLTPDKLFNRWNND